LHPVVCHAYNHYLWLYTYDWVLPKSGNLIMLLKYNHSWHLTIFFTFNHLWNRPGPDHDLDYSNHVTTFPLFVNKASGFEFLLLLFIDLFDVIVLYASGFTAILQRRPITSENLSDPSICWRGGHQTSSHCTGTQPPRTATYCTGLSSSSVKSPATGAIPKCCCSSHFK